MAVKRRWMRWIVTEAERFDALLPWERGYRRGLWRRHLGRTVVAFERTGS